jgi:DNA-binding NtrC family response regulator
VLIVGETGSGKGVLAGWLHRHGPRSHEPFVDVTCSAMFGATMDAELFGQDRGAGGGAQQGLLETADRGTLYLDGITDLDLGVQAKLLRVIENHRFRRLGDPRERTADVRVIASADRDLGQRVAEGLFRADLQYRLDVLRLRVPPLRDRSGDVPQLARLIVSQLALSMRRTEPSLSAACQQMLSAHAWPGNIRQLRNELERALQRCAGDVLQPEHFTLVDEKPPGLDLSTVQGTLEEVERAYIQRVLRETGRVEAAAQRLGVPRSTLYQKIRNYGLERPR